MEDPSGPVRNRQARMTRVSLIRRNLINVPVARDRMLEVVEYRLRRRMWFATNARRRGIMLVNVIRVRRYAGIARNQGILQRTARYLRLSQY